MGHRRLRVSGISKLSMNAPCELTRAVFKFRTTQSATVRSQTLIRALSGVFRGGPPDESRTVTSPSIERLRIPGESDAGDFDGKQWTH